MNMDESSVETLPNGTKIIIFTTRSLVRGFVRRSLMILCVYAAFAALEIWFHWYIGTQNTPSAHSWRDWYFQTDPLNGKPYTRGYLIWERPCVFLGFVTGIILGRSAVWVAELVLWALLLSFGVLALYPAYQQFFPGIKLYSNDLSLAFVFGALLCGFFIAVGRIITAHLLERKARRHALNNPEKPSVK